MAKRQVCSCHLHPSTHKKGYPLGNLSFRTGCLTMHCYIRQCCTLSSCDLELAALSDSEVIEQGYLVFVKDKVKNGCPFVRAARMRRQYCALFFAELLRSAPYHVGIGKKYGLLRQ